MSERVFKVNRASSVSFHKHCENPECTAGYVCTECPECKQKFKDTGLWWELHTVANGATSHFVCRKCKTYLCLVYQPQVDQFFLIDDVIL